jgi:uncharacterized protein (DUF983 family)
LFRRWFTMADHCPRCGHHFERHEGYWLGAVMINTGVAVAVFAVVLVGGMVATWPDVPWAALLVVTVAVDVVFPVVWYPVSKTLWVALDLAVHPLDPHEVEAAEHRAA